nr:hypothetical protein [Corynebacterium aquatimens]
MGVVVTVGIIAPRGNYTKTTARLIAGDWLGVAALALLMLIIFDGLGALVQRFVEGPIFGILLIATGILTAVLALRGDDNSKLIERIVAPLRTPSASTIGVGFALGLIQSATSVPFFGGLALLSTAGVSLTTRYAFLILYATVALSLPTVVALLVGLVRAKPDSAAARVFERARDNSAAVTSGATWAVAVLLTLLGVTHLL